MRTPKQVTKETKNVTASLLFHQKEYLRSKTLPKRRHYILLQLKEKKLSNLRKECRDIVMAGVLERQNMPRKKSSPKKPKVIKEIFEKMQQTKNHEKTRIQIRRKAQKKGKSIATQKSPTKSTRNPSEKEGR